MKLEIYNEEDRLKVAAILVKNGYTVRQSKEKRGPSSRSYVYYLHADKEEDKNDRSEQ